MELHHVHPDKLLGDKGYDSDDIRSDLADCGIQPVIPPRSNRKTPIEYDRETSGATSSSGASIVSSNSAASRLGTKNRQSLLLDVMHRSRKALDQNYQHGLVNFTA
jgi:IS5 family transposase